MKVRGGPFLARRVRFACFPRFLLLIAVCLAQSAHAQTFRALGPPGGDVRALAVDPANPQIVYLGTTDWHVFGSSDGGAHWSALGRVGPTPEAVVTSIVVDARDSHTLFASTWTREATGEAGGVYVSQDGGRTWREAGLGGHAVRALVAAPSDADVLVAGALDGVFRTRNHGASWERISPAQDAELRDFDSLAIDPRNAEIIYAGTFHLPWKTVDGGLSWRPIHRGMIDDSDVLSLAVDPARPERIFASACTGIYRSESSGSLWRKIQGIPYSSRRTPVIRLNPDNPSVIFAGTTEGLWRSKDAGSSWSRISPSSWVVNSMAIVPEDSRGGGERLLVGTEQEGVLVSEDDGASFRASNEGFNHRRILSLAVDEEKPGRVAAVLANASAAVIATDDGGQTWSPLGNAGEPPLALRVFWTPDGWWVADASGGLARLDPDRGLWVKTGEVREPEETADSTRPAPKTTRPRSFLSVVHDLRASDEGWYAATGDGVFVSRDRGHVWELLPAAAFTLPADTIRVSRDGQRLRVVSSGGMIFSDDGGKTADWRDLPFESGGARGIEFVDAATILALSRAALYISADSGMTWSKVQNGLPVAAPADLVVRADVWLVSMEMGGLYASHNRGADWAVVSAGTTAAGNARSTRFPLVVADERTGSIYAATASDSLYVFESERAASNVGLVMTSQK